MAFDKFLIGPLSVGLETDLKPFMIPDEAYARLNNAYVFRGRVRKRFGSSLMGADQRSSRLRIALGATDAFGDLSGTVPGSLRKRGQMFSCSADLFTVIDDTPGPQPMLATSITTAGDYDTATGNFNINSSIPLTQVYFYPAEPVMGLTLYEEGAINNHPAYAFDTQFAYVFASGAWSRSATGANPVWHGDDADFFWVANWESIIDNKTAMFVTNFHVVNYNGAVDASDDPIWTYKTATGWEVFTPQFLTAGDYVKTARIIVAFKNRLVLLNTVEVNGGNNKNYVNRCRFSQNGSPFEGGLPLCASAWLEQTQTGSHQAGYIDATTEEAIISAEFIKDRLIVYFERSTWELAYTGNEIQPFIWQKLNTELGSEASFSTVPFDKFILTVGNTGVHSCNGSNVVRVDDKIPDEIFQIRNKNEGVARVAGIRDYYTEMVYWTFPNASKANEQIFPNRVLIFNYKNNSWAFNDDCITAFGYFEQQQGMTWALATFTWASSNNTWQSGTLQSEFRQVIAGNQQGFVTYILPDRGSNASAMQITEMSYDPLEQKVFLTIMNHTLSVGEFIRISGVVGVTLSGTGIYQVTDRWDENLIQVGPVTSFTGTYLGGGTVARVSQIDILSKQWNFYNDAGKDVFIQKIDCNVNKTTAGQITIDYYPSTTELSMLDEAQDTGARLGTGVLETSPFALQPIENQQSQLWHPVFLQSDGQTIQIRMYLSPTQMVDPVIAESDFQLNAMVLYAQPVSRLQ